MATVKCSRYSPVWSRTESALNDEHRLLMAPELSDPAVIIWDVYGNAITRRNTSVKSELAPVRWSCPSRRNPRTRHRWDCAPKEQ